MNVELNNHTKMMRATDTILENLLDAVLVVNQEGKIIYANQAAQELFSQKASELTGAFFGFPITPYKVQEIEVIKGGRMLTVQMLASHINWDEQTASLLSLRDMTAQKATQTELIRQQRLLEKSNEENSQYASLASHDLKEPIRKILMFSERLLASETLPMNDRAQVEKIHSATKRMHSLIKGIAELSSLNQVRHVFKPIALRSVVEEVVSDLEILIEEKNAVIEIHDLPTVHAIGDGMYQLFLNLISNSLKYSRKDTPAHIRIQEQDCADGYVCIECADNGIGFDNKMAKKLFQPFQRLHTKQYEGMGIGLTLCQKIVAIHHGEISAEGSPGHGAKFMIRLPA